MKLLLDANLSYRLAKKIVDHYPDCLHVTRTGLPAPASDRAIWQWAKTNDRVIITNDDDYYHLAIYTDFRPRLFYCVLVINPPRPLQMPW